MTDIEIIGAPQSNFVRAVRRAGGDQRRGQGPAPGSPGAEGGRRRAALELRLLKKSMIADGDSEE